MKIQDLLTDERFSDLCLIGGASGIDHSISAVTVIDTPDGFRWLKGGELVITTAFMLKDDQEALVNFMQNLKKQNASGFGVKVGRYIDEIPQSAIKMADSLQLPLIRIPANYPFVDIINPILSKIINQQASRLMQANIIHSRFTELAISDATIVDNLTAFMVIVGVPVAFWDFEVNQIWFSDEGSELAQELKRLDPSSHSEGILDEYDMHPIIHRNHKFGYLIFEKGVLANHSYPGFQTALENAVTNIILREQTLISNRQVAEQYQNSLVQDLLIHNIKSETEIHTRAEVFGWDFHHGGMVLVVDINNIKKKFTEYISANTHQILEQMISEIFQIAIEEMDRHYSNVHHMKFSDIITFIVSLKPEERMNIEDGVQEVFRRIQKRITNIPFTISIGVGRYQENIEDIHLSNQQATSAINLSYTFDWYDRVLYYDKMSLFRLVLPILDSPEAMNECMNCLQPLLRYDETTGKNMLKTLQIVAECDWNIKLASERMFLHPNSVKYRMEHISNLVKMNFRERSDRILMEIALLVYTMGKDKFIHE